MDPPRAVETTLTPLPEHGPFTVDESRLPPCAEPPSSESAGVSASYDMDKDGTPPSLQREEAPCGDTPPAKRRKLQTSTGATIAVPCPPASTASSVASAGGSEPPAPGAGEPTAPQASLSTQAGAHAHAYPHPHPTPEQPAAAPATPTMSSPRAGGINPLLSTDPSRRIPKELRDLMDHTWHQTQDLCFKLDITRQQQTTRLTMYYMWRFYLGHPAHDAGTQGHDWRIFDRRVMHCACLFLAAKRANTLLFPLKRLLRHMWDHKPDSEEFRLRQEQIMKAELYLVATVLKFDFSHQADDYIVKELRHLCKLELKQLVGTQSELSWTIPAWQQFLKVYRTPLIVRYTAHELVAGWLWLYLDFMREQKLDVWAKLSGGELKVDFDRWLKNLRNIKVQPQASGFARPAATGDARHAQQASAAPLKFRIDEVREELEREMQLIQFTPESIAAELKRNSKRLRTHRERSMSLHAPGSANGDRGPR